MQQEPVTDRSLETDPTVWRMPVSVSVIIEWKNQDLADDARAEAMLRALHTQWLQVRDAAAQAPRPRLSVATLAPRLELIFVYDGEASKRNLDGQLAGRFDDPEDAFGAHRVQGAGLSYYQMKHLGAEKARGDILIFLDSDVVPEPGWLGALLDAVLSDGVLIVCGNTFIEPNGLLGKAFALAWFFPLRSNRSGIEADAKCYSNNLAVRSATYGAFPFIEVPGTTRAAMRQLTTRLAANGVTVYKCHDAQVSHPHPRNLSHFLKRGIVHGRDIYLKSNHDAGRQLSGRRLGDALREVWQRYVAGVQRTIGDYRQVDLKPRWIPVVLAIMTFYYVVFASGSLVTHLAPGPMSRVLKI